MKLSQDAKEKHVINQGKEQYRKKLRKKKLGRSKISKPCLQWKIAMKIKSQQKHEGKTTCETKGGRGKEA